MYHFEYRKIIKFEVFSNANLSNLFLNNFRVIFSSKVLHRVGLWNTSLLIISPFLLYFQDNISTLNMPLPPSYTALLPRSFLIKLYSFTLVKLTIFMWNFLWHLLSSSLHSQSELSHSLWWQVEFNSYSTQFLS